MFGDALPEGGTHGAYRGQAAGTTGWEAAEAAAWAIWDTPQSRDCSEVHLHKSNAVAVQPVGQLCCAGEQARKMHQGHGRAPEQDNGKLGMHRRREYAGGMYTGTDQACLWDPMRSRCYGALGGSHQLLANASDGFQRGGEMDDFEWGTGIVTLADSSMGNSRFDGAIERRLQSGEKAFLLQSVLKTGAQGQSSGQDLPPGAREMFCGASLTPAEMGHSLGQYSNAASTDGSSVQARATAWANINSAVRKGSRAQIPSLDNMTLW
eukprot:CAMPEP_0174328766 /NCGR_PEP_ID=MMETSP0810-20121108/15353_1 /TAXON_ID=73025 ORGANISM="Eutreptiella gymnastica-like, Strain CCMP1594" /NCGR_SAMPLE_ID=MMETSP0810 /ASSEMBLY_ACC=CAM_ASM_000659 /LENGTH=264 /DNA_ID=CAMNT_0015442957 /DNA_START=204 /DNA_END=997 /DNA_ORIENTATION=+